MVAGNEVWALGCTEPVETGEKMAKANEERPYKRHSVKSLEEVFSAYAFNMKVLRALNTELEERSTKSAKRLQGKVQARITEIKNREPFWRNRGKEKKQQLPSNRPLTPSPQPVPEPPAPTVGRATADRHPTEPPIIPPVQEPTAASPQQGVSGTWFLFVVLLLSLILAGLFFSQRYEIFQQKTEDPYLSLLSRGLSHDDVRFVLRPILIDSGIEETRIHIYFAKHDKDYALRHNIKTIDEYLIKDMGASLSSRIKDYEKQIKSLLD